MYILSILLTVQYRKCGVLFMLYSSSQFEFIKSNDYYYFFTKAVKKIDAVMSFGDGFSISNLDEIGCKIVKERLVDQYNSLKVESIGFYSVDFLGELVMQNIIKTESVNDNLTIETIEDIGDYISRNLVCLKIEPNKVEKIFPFFKSFNKDLMEGSELVDVDIVIEAFFILINDGIQDLLIFSNFLKNGSYHEFMLNHFEDNFLINKINILEISTLIDDFCDNYPIFSEYVALDFIKSYYTEMVKTVSSLDTLDNLSNIKDVISMDYKIGPYKSQINLLNTVSLFENLLCGDVAQNHLIDDSISLHFSRNIIFILEIINLYEQEISNEKTIIYDTKIYKKMLKEIYGLRSKIIHGSYSSTQSEANKICLKKEYKDYFESYREEYDSISKINAFLSDVLSRILHLYISKPNLFNILKGV